MSTIKIRYFWVIGVAILLLASISILGASANSNIDQIIDPTPIVEKNSNEAYQPRIQVEQSIEPSSVTGGPDAYGYEWDAGTYGWIDITSTGQIVSFGNADDDFNGPIAIGFSFPFYEKNYASLYISTNGLVTFERGTSDPSNRVFPFIDEPQAVIAPFWDDLTVGGLINSGHVYYQKVSATRFVISYVDVARIGGGVGDTLTFQIILDSSGTITFQYSTLNGTLDSATVGIEDHDGVVGLTYLHNSDMSALYQQALVFSRPSDTNHRPKALPIYQGAFTVNGELELTVKVYNAGDVSEAYDLIVQNSNLAWQLQLYDSFGQQITRDTNHNGHVETPVLAPDSEYIVIARFIAPDGAGEGSTAVVNLNVATLTLPSVVWSVRMQTTVPASFAQAVKDSGDIDLRAVSKYGQRQITVFPLYTGSSMGVQGLAKSRYMMYWERNGERFESGKFISWTNIEQAVVNDFGQDILNATTVTNNSQVANADQNVFDSEPVSAMTSDGHVGLAWVRRIDRQSDNKSNFNIYMAVIDSDDTTSFIKSAFRVTPNENGWAGFGDLNIPKYTNPRITVTPNNKFFLSWTDEQQTTSGTKSNIGIAAFNSSGGVLLSARNYSGLTSIAGNILYRYSTVLGLADNRILLGYSHFDVATQVDVPGYAILDTNGVTVAGGDPRLLTGVQGQYPVALQLPNNKIVYAWTMTETENNSIISSQIAYVLINPSNNYAPSPHLELATPDGLQGDYVSLTQDNPGNAVFTWIDTDIERNLYYALVDSTGALVTPAMLYYEIEPGKALLVNQSGRGNAFYDYRFGIFLPLTKR